MKKFTDICRMSQTEVKEYMVKYLTGKEYEPIAKDGFVYAKGSVPVLLVAHMDTVHKQKCVDISELNGKISSPQGIGGDDRCGIFIIMNIVKNLHCSVLLCEDEEKGGIGANKFIKTEYIKNLGVNYMIEFDRRGNKDAVFYSCANDEFTKFVLDNTKYTKAYGSFSDISVLAPEAKICAVNLSSGYYSPHTVDEYVIFTDMMNTAYVASEMIQAECAEPFEYKKLEEKYKFDGVNKWTQISFDDYKMPATKLDKRKSLPEVARDDIEVTLEAIVIGRNGAEEPLYGTGATKMECWFDLFTSYTDVCFDDIVDYSFS